MSKRPATPSRLYRNYGLPVQRTSSAVAPSHRRPKQRMLLSLIVVLAIGLGAAGHHVIGAQTGQQVAHNRHPSDSVAALPAAIPSVCQANRLQQEVIVSISERHLWACDGNKLAYQSAVITGMDFLAADLTPTGTYHVYAKYTNQTLKGCDSTGCWNDPVSYWLPWLSNQYGTYGFHDATWRPNSDFGHISPDSPNASHGCVELPLATAAWLYNWASIGTTLNIVS